ncbi:MAG: hypothetical protein LBN29_13845 [Mediterranea sp.]|jgi:predicted helicase|nr:hypothetical protein [Mediterranea sp.]
MSKATIYYHDIGDYLSREEKLEILRKMGSIENPAMQWEVLHPNEHHDWINQRNEGFGEFIPLAPEKKMMGKQRVCLRHIHWALTPTGIIGCTIIPKQRCKAMCILQSLFIMNK